MGKPREELMAGVRTSIISKDLTEEDAGDRGTRRRNISVRMKYI